MQNVLTGSVIGSKHPTTVSGNTPERLPRIRDHPEVTADNREEFIRQNVDQTLRHEGEAALANAIAREEILVAGGPDIGVRGGLDEFYINVYDRSKQGPPDGLTRDDAISLMSWWRPCWRGFPGGGRRGEGLRYRAQVRRERPCSRYRGGTGATMVRPPVSQRQSAWLRIESTVTSSRPGPEPSRHTRT